MRIRVKWLFCQIQILVSVVRFTVSEQVPHVHASQGQPGSSNINFLQISDIHLDLSATLLDLRTCSGIGSQWAALPSDVHCDTPLPVLRSALEAAAAHRPAFVLWTGDTAPRGAAVTRQDVLASLQAASDAFRELLPGVPVFPVLGNQDHVPASTDPGPPHNAWLTEAAATMWADWLSKDAQAVLKWNGFYDLQVSRGLRVIALNTEVCHVKNWYAFVDQVAADEMLAWLEMTLRRAQRDGQRCLIIGHIPPGLWTGCWADYSSRYQALVSMYSQVVIGQFFGHQHEGSFRLLRPEDAQQAAFAVTHVAPALSGGQGQAPSFRIFTLDSHAWRVSGLRQFTADVQEAAAGAGGTAARGQAEEDALQWVVGFEPEQQFQMPDLAAASFEQLWAAMRSNASLLAAYRHAECNGCQHVGAGQDDDSYLCGVAYVADKPYRDCIRKAEDELVQQYTSTEHTYVLSSLYPFKVVMSYFCHHMPNLHVSDCPNAGIPPPLPV